MQGFNATLVKDKKRLFIPYNFQIGYYVVKDASHAKQEGQVHLEYRFRIGSFQKTWSQRTNLKHAEKVS
jgi:hypothetical protein